MEFHSLSSSTWDDPFLIPPTVGPGEEAFEDDGYYASAFAQGSSHANGNSTPTSTTPSGMVPPSNPAEGIKKILSGGTFYFPTNGDWDMSQSLREWDWKRMTQGETEGVRGGCLDGMDERFGECDAPLWYSR